MPATLLVSISSIFTDTRVPADQLIRELEAMGVPVSLLIAPHIDGNWHLAKDRDTRRFFDKKLAAGHAFVLNGFDQPVQGRRAEFATLPAHEARLRLAGATKQMRKLGFTTTAFAPPRWRLSEGTLEVLPEFGFTRAMSTWGIHIFDTDSLVQARNLSVGEGYGASSWWRLAIRRAVERTARRGGVVRLSVSARNLAKRRVARDVAAMAEAALELGARPATYLEEF
ncbi:DUF2334 domain-containing protein [Corynebacterium pyruviciproducens]|uniref:DUF2334 domain-containing protein n=1 Tax=Corynebacterium pyruviciproducens TaxID=598660 RepID=A0AAF0YQU9_9CORY|nr:DUF2334 domain-containing protein [Corynebacterium pyruviciproducens]WOT02472.1 DUF2334 domain-containing protein [Corynebacterium pyruviciproducens]